MVVHATIMLVNRSQPGINSAVEQDPKPDSPLTESFLVTSRSDAGLK